MADGKKRRTVNDGPKTFDSPSTPGLKVTFGNYIVELIFANRERQARRALPPYFWRQPQWGEKYSRTCRGYMKLSSLHDQLDDAIYCQALINAVRATNCMSLLMEEPLARLDQEVMDQYRRLVAERDRAEQAPQAPVIEDQDEFMRNNARIVNTDGPSKLERLKGIEQRGQGETS